MPTRASNPLTLATPADDTAPSFLIGQDGEGYWVAVEIHGLGGGIFRDRDHAVHYARDESHGRPGAIRLVTEPLALAMPGTAAVLETAPAGLAPAERPADVRAA